MAKLLKFSVGEIIFNVCVFHEVASDIWGSGHHSGPCIDGLRTAIRHCKHEFLPEIFYRRATGDASGRPHRSTLTKCRLNRRLLVSLGKYLVTFRTYQWHVRRDSVQSQNGAFG